MGVITPSFSEQRARLPWLHRDHPLQRDEVFHASLGTGLCGCLTSFASWNTQMVVMLDGKYCELGSQVVTVFFGYVLGLMGAICGFQFGRQCGLWMHNFKHRNEEEVDTLHLEESQTVELHSEQQAALHQGIELVDDSNVNLKPVPSHLHKIPLFLAAVCLLVAFIIGDAVNNIEFYRGMTLLWILSPVGSLLRWRLSNLNIRKEGEINTNTPSWIPWGTFGANMTATVIAAFIEGLYSRYFYGADQTSTNKWVIAIFFALKTGVAGSLSTVSTMIKECVYLSEKHAGMAKAHYYTCFTCICGCVLGLIVYASTIRINI
ncbi:MAG: fluoride ion exporter CrcB/FEX [Bacillariaceae sp.]|jgi:fluoride ion exporter CrcB/FEX